MRPAPITARNASNLATGSKNVTRGSRVPHSVANVADRRRTNYICRLAGVIICLAPVALTLASLLGRPARSSRLVLLPLAFAAGIGLLNFHLSFVRPWMFKRRHGSFENYQFVSGLPAIGTVVVVLTVIASFGVRLVAFAGLAILAIDTGGLPWFLLSTWRDRGLWDGAA